MSAPPDDDIVWEDEDIEWEAPAQASQAKPTSVPKPEYRGPELSAGGTVDAPIEFQPSTAETNVRALRQGLSLGAADELEGLGAGFKEFLKLGGIKGAQEAYRRKQKAEEVMDTAAVDTNPLLKVAGNMASYQALAPLNTARTVLGGILKGGALGGASAGFQGAAESKETGVKSLKDAALPAAVGTGLGAVFGGLQGANRRAEDLRAAATKEATQAATTQVDNALASQAGKLGSAKADVNRSLEVLMDRGTSPKLPGSVQDQAKNVLESNTGREALGELVESKAQDLPAQAKRFQELARAYEAAKNAAPAEKERLMQEMLKAPGFADFLKQRASVIAETAVPKDSRLRMLLKQFSDEALNPAQKMSLANALGGNKMLVNEPVAKSGLLEWLRSKKGE